MRCYREQGGLPGAACLELWFSVLLSESSTFLQTGSLGEAPSRKRLRPSKLFEKRELERYKIEKTLPRFSVERAL